MIDITRDKPIKIAVRVAVPVKDHPKASIWADVFKWPTPEYTRSRRRSGEKTRLLLFLNCDLQFNFVGKLLGPKGNSLKRLQEETMCKMSVLGRGSMRDRKKVTKRIRFRRKGSVFNFSSFFISRHPES